MCTRTNTKYPIRVFSAETQWDALCYGVQHNRVPRTTTRSVKPSIRTVRSTITRFTRLRSLDYGCYYYRRAIATATAMTVVLVLVTRKESRPYCCICLVLSHTLPTPISSYHQPDRRAAAVRPASCQCCPRVLGNTRTE